MGLVTSFHLVFLQKFVNYEEDMFFISVCFYS